MVHKEKLKVEANRVFLGEIALNFLVFGAIPEKKGTNLRKNGIEAVYLKTYFLGDEGYI